MAFSRDRMLIRLEAENKKLHTQLDASNKKIARFQRDASKSMRLAGKAFAAFGVVVAGALTKKIVQATARQEAALRQLEQGWKTTGGAVGLSVAEIQRHAEDLQKQTIFGDEQIVEAQSQLITFTNVAEEQFARATEAALDLSTRMGTDLKSSVIQIGKVLNDPAAQLSALARSGIQFNDQQTEMIRSLQESGDLIGAQSIVLEELERQFGGSARAARDTFGGAIEGLQNAFGDLFEGSGGKGGLSDSKDAIEDLTGTLQDPTVVAGISAFTTMLITGFSQALSLIGKTIKGIDDLAKKMTGFVEDDTSIAEVQAKIADLEAKLVRENSSYFGSGNKEYRKQLEDDLAYWQARLNLLRRNKELGDSTLTASETVAAAGGGSALGGLAGVAGAGGLSSGTEAQISAEAEAAILENDRHQGRMAHIAELNEAQRAAAEDEMRRQQTMNERFKGWLGYRLNAHNQYASSYLSIADTLLSAEKRNAIKTVAADGWVAIQKAWASAPFPLNVPPVALATGSAAANLAGVSGVFHDGGRIPTDGTYLLQGGEYVLNRDRVAQIEAGAGGVNVSNNFSISMVDATNAEQFVNRVDPLIRRNVNRALNNRGKPSQV